MQDQAYFVTPPAGLGPGVLLLPAWWGLTAAVRQRADRVAAAGFTVLAPDMALGNRPATESEAEKMLADADPNRLASLVNSSAGLLADRAVPGPIGVIGYGMGGSLGLWLSVRQPDLVKATVSFYGSQVIDFAGAVAAYQIHLAESDRYIPDDEAAFMEATMGLEELDVTVHVYPGTEHGFADPDSPTYQDESARLAFDRTVGFLQTHL